MKYLEFRSLVGRPFFRRSDIDVRSATIYGAQLSRWVKEGHLIKVRRGVYVFADARASVASEVLSLLLYEPSYISCEYALHHYGFIPEAVYAMTAITPRTTRSFHNAFGRFAYRHIRRDLFWGYAVVAAAAGKYLLAEPEKALLDYAYFRTATLADPGDIAEWRLNAEEFRRVVDETKLKNYLARFEHKALERSVAAILAYAHA